MINHVEQNCPTQTDFLSGQRCPWTQTYNFFGEENYLQACRCPFSPAHLKSSPQIALLKTLDFTQSYKHYK